MANMFLVPTYYFSQQSLLLEGEQEKTGKEREEENTLLRVATKFCLQCLRAVHAFRSDRKQNVSYSVCIKENISLSNFELLESALVKLVKSFH